MNRESNLPKRPRGVPRGSSWHDIENSPLRRMMRDIESSPLRRMMRDIENSPLQRAIREMQQRGA